MALLVMMMFVPLERLAWLEFAKEERLLLVLLPDSVILQERATPEPAYLSTRLMELLAMMEMLALKRILAKVAFAREETP